GYAEAPTPGRYLLVLAAFALGLLGKPMMVTFPFVLLLLDCWPLRRPLTRRLLLEKLPLFTLTVLACLVTMYAQRAGEAIVPLADVPPALRVANALVAYCTYLLKAVWPTGQAVFYPYPGGHGRGRGSLSDDHFHRPRRVLRLLRRHILGGK